MLKAEKLTKQYDDVVALNGVDLEVAAGEVFCLLGGNGAGKSTTLNIFLGFLPASGGEAWINDISVSRQPLQTKKHLAYIPEVVQLYPSLTGVENLDFFSRLAGFRYRTGQLERMLEQAGLQVEACHRRMATYSKGMRQKVGIAIALAKKAGALLMDEPTSGLDPRAIEEFTVLVKSFSAQGGAVLMATHDIFNAVAIGTHIGIMREGEMVHRLRSVDITAGDLQKLYLETISK
ncbi:MAG TPA: ABC transporter ATP-binding protein [Puia sp.]|uniref:ABC transporter ATP-binding protein n=1 Tax=Puia sp. TaxID=2045100 RepID=UPI002CFD7D78|nr:ABC transporter ATP-binding protein [Puia sp.]HVU94711.1 ABC transporter ATP-binding protein [Puia sp.]